MNTPTITASVLGALLALALAYIAHLRRHLVAAPVDEVEVEVVTYGRRAGDRLVDYVELGIHFCDVYELCGVTDSRDDHGTNITDSLFTTGKAVA